MDGVATPEHCCRVHRLEQKLKAHGAVLVHGTLHTHMVVLRKTSRQATEGSVKIHIHLTNARSIPHGGLMTGPYHKHCENEQSSVGHHVVPLSPRSPGGWLHNSCRRCCSGSNFPALPPCKCRIPRSGRSASRGRRHRKGTGCRHRHQMQPHMRCTPPQQAAWFRTAHRLPR